MEFTELIDLAAEKLGGAVLYANDEFFAPKENLLRASAPIFIEGKYTDLGKWMDGWESRRRRTPGFDWCLVRLGLPGKIRGVTVDTSHFKGNYPEQCSLEAVDLPGYPTVDELTNESLSWTEILPVTALQGDSQNHFPIQNSQRTTHLRFKIYPDGGVARLRVYGEVLPDWDRLKRLGGSVDLAAAENGGLVLSCSDMFFGHRHNLIMPGRAANMSDGWETKRRRGPGHDWSIIKLGSPGQITNLEVDTAYFKGNFPESCSLEAVNILLSPTGRGSGTGLVSSSSHPTPPSTGEGVRSTDSDLSSVEVPWRQLLPRTKLLAHTRHFFETELMDVGTVSHVRFNIFPDGGVSRLRVYGKPA